MHSLLPELTPYFIYLVVPHFYYSLHFLAILYYDYLLFIFFIYSFHYILFLLVTLFIYSLPTYLLDTHLLVTLSGSIVISNQAYLATRQSTPR